MQSIASPRSYNHEAMGCFVELSSNMEYRTGDVEFLTSSEQLQSFSELFGPDAVIWISLEIEKRISETIGKLIKIVEVFNEKETIKMNNLLQN